MNKLISILLSILLIFTGFNYPIFADETEDESNETESTEVSNDTESIETENKKEIDSINNEIKSIKNDIKSINTTLDEYPTPPFENTGLGRATSFDFLTPEQLITYRDYFSNIGCLYIAYVENFDENQYLLAGTFYNDTNIYPDSTSFIIESNNSIYVVPDGTLTYIVNENFQNQYYPLHYSNDFDTFLVVRNKDYNLYSLNPYKLNVVNNGLGAYSNSVVSEPYLSTNIYYSGQSITLTYNNENNDFYGWFDNSGNLLSNELSYSFNINSDTTIILNYPLLNDSNNSFDSTYLIYIILLLTLLFFTNIEKGVLNGN